MSLVANNFNSALKFYNPGVYHTGPQTNAISFQGSGASTALRVVEQATDGLLVALGRKDSYTAKHCRELADLAEKFAKAVIPYARQKGINLSAAEVKIAAKAHDVGKIHFPPALFTAKTKFTLPEKDAILKHPIESGNILEQYHKKIADICRHHHERWDGTGYPYGLRGNDIPFESRLLSIVDAFHAMTSGRPYVPTMSSYNACKIIEKGAGTQFDPELTKIFLRHIPEFYKPVQRNYPTYAYRDLNLANSLTSSM